ncbi:MAG: hypothetical protein AAF721_11065 [Myxococcota bacterium]
MHALASTVLIFSLAAPDPRTIDPDANRPDIVTEGGATATAPVIPTVPPPADGSAATPPPVVPSGPPPPPGPATTPTPPTTPPAGTGTTPPEGGQPKVTPTPTEPEPDVDRTQKCFPARGRCRRLNIAGLSTLSVGVALLATGIAFTQVAPFPQEDEPVFNRSLAPPGKALVGVGVAAILAGGLLIGSGVAVHRKFQSGEEKLAKAKARAKRRSVVRLDAGGLHW